MADRWLGAWRWRRVEKRPWLWAASGALGWLAVVVAVWWGPSRVFEACERGWWALNGYKATALRTVLLSSSRMSEDPRVFRMYVASARVAWSVPGDARNDPVFRIAQASSGTAVSPMQAAGFAGLAGVLLACGWQGRDRKSIGTTAHVGGIDRALWWLPLALVGRAGWRGAWVSLALAVGLYAFSRVVWIVSGWMVPVKALMSIWAWDERWTPALMVWCVPAALGALHAARMWATHRLSMRWERRRLPQVCPCGYPRPRGVGGAGSAGCPECGLVLEGPALRRPKLSRWVRGVDDWAIRWAVGALALWLSLDLVGATSAQFGRSWENFRWEPSAVRLVGSGDAVGVIGADGGQRGAVRIFRTAAGGMLVLIAEARGATRARITVRAIEHPAPLNALRPAFSVGEVCLAAGGLDGLDAELSVYTVTIIAEAGEAAVRLPRLNGARTGEWSGLVHALDAWQAAHTRRDLIVRGLATE